VQQVRQLTAARQLDPCAPNEKAGGLDVLCLQAQLAGRGLQQCVAQHLLLDDQQGLRLALPRAVVQTD